MAQVLALPRPAARFGADRIARRLLAALAVAAAVLAWWSPGGAQAATPPTLPPIVAPVPAGGIDSTIAPIEQPELPDADDADDAGGSGTSVFDVLDQFDAVPADDDPAESTATIGISVPDSEDASDTVTVILLLTVLSLAPSILIMMTSFTRIVVVMSLTRNALGIPQLPPQQVIVGLSLFLTMFVMGPTLSELNDVALQPLLDGQVSVTEAADAASGPMREFMLEYTREPELEMFLDATETELPVERDEVPMTALIPAFMLSELKSAFILGFIIFVPFLVIDLVVSAVLTSLGMMMMPPTFVSLPMKLLLFVLLDGWSLVVGTLLRSYQ